MIDVILNADCREILPTLPKVSLVITSPPYRANKSYEDSSTIEQYVDFAKSWVSLIPNVVSDDGSFWLNLGYTKVAKNETLPLTYLYHPLVKMKLIQEIVWHYEGGMSYKKRFTHRTERWMWFSHDPDNVKFHLDAVRDMALNKTNDKRNNPLGKNPSDLWEFDRVVSGTGRTAEKTSHPCQFPEAMIKRIILACSDEGDIVLDPMCGSGTVCAVAKKLNRHFIGIEASADYCKEAIERTSRS